MYMKGHCISIKKKDTKFKKQLTAAVVFLGLISMAQLTTKLSDSIQKSQIQIRFFAYMGGSKGNARCYCALYVLGAKSL